MKPAAMLAVGMLLAGGLACADDDELVRGDGAEVFGATAHAFGLVQDGHVTEVGLAIPGSAIRAAASAGDFVIEFPREVREQLQIDHVYLNFNPQGHLPAGVYDVPHFDVHFYLIDAATRAAITCPETEVPTERLPVGYFIPGLAAEPQGTCVPGMGVHAVNGRAPELMGQAFTSTLILVYHAGALVAIEPMITVDTLASRAAVDLPVARPASTRAGLRWPTRYRVDYLAGTDEYRIVLTTFQ